VERIGFAFNPTKPAAMELRDRALAWCVKAGCEGWALESGDTPRLVEELKSTDCLVVLGGDGTFLRATRALAIVDVPVLGVNSGRVGFLSKIEPDALEETLGQLIRGDYAIEPRMMLQARIARHAHPESSPPAPGDGALAALNDAAIVRGGEARVLHLDVSIDDSHLASYVADGVVVATPTGSTAYSFSAGGPILDPTSKNLIVTPVAAYLSSIRSVIVGPSHVVCVQLVDGPPAIVSIDGRDNYPIEPGDSVEIRTLERPLRLVEPRNALPFWELLRQKAAILPA
jgi:NAD+ kinase